LRFAADSLLPGQMPTQEASRSSQPKAALDLHHWTVRAAAIAQGRKGLKLVKAQPVAI